MARLWSPFDKRNVMHGVTYVVDELDKDKVLATAWMDVFLKRPTDETASQQFVENIIYVYVHWSDQIIMTSIWKSTFYEMGLESSV